MLQNVYSWDIIHRFFPPEDEEEDVKIIIKKAQNERERIKVFQSEFEKDMIHDGISLSESKLGGLKEKMNSAIHGVHRIAHEFNTDILVIGKIINIGKSRVHEILAFAKIYKQNNILNIKTKHLKRPEKPLRNFSMDFTQKRLGNGEIGYIFGVSELWSKSS